MFIFILRFCVADACSVDYRINNECNRFSYVECSLTNNFIYEIAILDSVIYFYWDEYALHLLNCLCRTQIKSSKQELAFFFGLFFGLFFFYVLSFWLG